MPNFSNDALLNPLHGGAVANGGGYLGAQLGNHARLDGCLRKYTPFRHIVAHRLLAVYMLTGVDSCHGDDAVIMIGPRDIARVDMALFLFVPPPPDGLMSGP